jgi:hypothetical protein
MMSMKHKNKKDAQNGYGVYGYTHCANSSQCITLV